ncbi:helix-turn-helix transcriptional regulator [Microbacterium pumilum]|uniref:LuxR family transcriptional regulator n=1 Tax=Microbacterium pumilum TaxID=344165 RepID=A0ABN2S0V9_9MICO
MTQLLGREAVVSRVVAALERTDREGTSVVVVCGPAGVGTSAVVEEALRPLGAKVARAQGALPSDATAPVWWIDDAQRLPLAAVDRLRAGIADGTRVVLLSGRTPLGEPLETVVRDAVRADPACVVDVSPLDADVAVIAVRAPGLDEAAPAVDAERAVRLAADSGSRLRLLAAVLASDEGDGVRGTAVRVAVDDLLRDLTPPARRLLDVVVTGGGDVRAAAVERVFLRDGDASRESFDEVLAELESASLVEVDGVRLPMGVPIVAEVIAAEVGASRAAALHVAYAETLASLEGVDPRETAVHVHAVADRLPRAFSTSVLTAAAERRFEALDPLGAAVDLAAAAALLEVAADRGSTADRAAAFDVLLKLGIAYYQGGRIEPAHEVYRRAERFQDAASPTKIAEFELNRTYVRADRGHPASVPLAYSGPPDGGVERSADVAVMRLFLVDRDNDPVELDAVCTQLIALDGDAASAAERGAAALGSSIRASMAGDHVLARAEAERALRMAGDSSVIVYGGIQRELIRLNTLYGDLAAALRHADGDSFALAGRIPRVVEGSAIIHGASVALLQGDVLDAAARAERALTATRLSPVPRGIVRCVSWVAVISAMRGDLARARMLIAEAGRLFPLDGNLRLAAIVLLARAQLALRESGAMPPSVDLSLERVEGPARLLLPLLLARLAILNGDAATVERALDELDRLEGSLVAAALAQRVRALMLVPTRRRRDAADALDESATTLERLGFRGFAAETRLEWAELAAERADPTARAAVVGLVPYFDAQGLDDWSDRSRRLARTLGVRIGGRRGGVGELTRRESEVVDLVLAGLTNADVARRLFLSERTVETHLQHVYRRLGVDSRLGLITKLGAVSAVEADDG